MQLELERVAVNKDFRGQQQAGPSGARFLRHKEWPLDVDARNDFQPDTLPESKWQELFGGDAAVPRNIRVAATNSPGYDYVLQGFLYLFTALNFNENRVWKKGWTKSALAVTVR